MAEKVDLQVQLKTNLKEVVDATKGMKLDKGQEERFTRYSKGAQLALDSGDLKTFQKNLNGLIKVFKEAASVTGKVSEEIKKLTDKQNLLNREINSLKDKKTTLESKLTKDGSRLTTKAASDFHKNSDVAKKIKTGDGRVATRNEIVELQQALNKFLLDTGKTISQVTNKHLENIKTSSGVTLANRNAMFALHQYGNSEKDYYKEVSGGVKKTGDLITQKETEYSALSNELTRMSSAADSGAKSINELYTKISKLGDATNKAITNELNEQKITKTDRTGAESLGSINTDVVLPKNKPLTGAFKQFTAYNIALRAIKTALREAVQTVKELDKYLTEQAMVTGMTREQTYGLVKEYQNLALQCGATTKEIAQVSTEYMKQGKTIQESLVLTEAAVKAAKVARVSVGDSVNYLTTALNGFRLSAEDAMKVSDKFAAVAASSATDYDELAIALSKVASQANLAGMSIDYTTALLTKGLETTREAPETMGTALKTIIARMREMGDYGETLEDGTDINNVESQLAYVGIALRDQQGELRSTEEVLDQLGKKWDTLNKNQQAAIAKALAGTRQQSRLIAMMEDYERVTELQEISQRSAGATAAQAGVYLEGMEAALNKIQVAWEKIVMTITNSEFIIGILDSVGNLLDFIGSILDSTAGGVIFITAIATTGALILTQKIAEWETQKALNRATLDKQRLEIKAEKLEKQKIISGKKVALNKIRELKTQLAINEAVANEALLDDDKTNDAIARAELVRLKNEELEITEQEKILEAEIKATEAEIGVLNMKEATTSLEILKNGQGLTSALGGVLSILTPIMSIMTMIATIQQVQNTATATGILLKKKENQEEKKGLGTKVAGMFAKVVQAFSSGGIPGVIAGIAIATALAVGLGVAIAASVGAFSGDTGADKAADEVNKLSAEIYKLNEKVQAIDKITDSFDSLDNKLIKTNSDLKEMSSLLDQAADQLNTEVDEENDWYKGKSEKEYYESFTSDEGKRRALELIKNNNRNLANQKRSQQINKIKNLSGTELGRFLDDNTTDTEVLQAQDAIYALNNNELYEYIDLMKEKGELRDEEAAAVESLTQKILEGMSVEEAWAYAKEDDGKKVQKLAQSLQELKMVVKDTNGEMNELNVGRILNSDDYSLKDQVKAFETTRDSLLQKYSKTSEEFKAFQEAFNQYDYFVGLEEGTLDFIDSIGIGVDGINDLYGAWETLQKKGVKISQKEWEDNFDLYLETLAATQGDVLATTERIFGHHLQDSKDALNAFVEAYGDLVQVGVLNMGQNMDKIKNSINNFYEKALEWNEMSESDKAEFIQDNADLFSDGELLKAFESGDYNAIEEALSKNSALQKQLEQRKKEVEQELLIEEARKGEDRNEAYIAQLKAYKKYLSDTESLFKASLEVRLEQEQQQLDEYRSLMEEEQEALEESLNKRKDAYEKYFDAIAQEEEDEEYEEQADLLISNLSKLGSSSNATAQQQTKELEQKLEELEEERLKELRERAQEAIIQNIDDELAEISDKFDKLLESNQALLAAMNGSLDDPAKFVTNMISKEIGNGQTDLGMEQYIENLKTTYGSVLGDKVDWEVLKEEIHQLFMNVNGQEITLNQEEQQTIYSAVMAAMTQVGKR